MKKLLFFFLFIIFLVPNISFAKTFTVNGRLSEVNPPTKVEAQYATPSGKVRTSDITEWFMAGWWSGPPTPYKIGDTIVFIVDDSVVSGPDDNQTIKSAGIVKINEGWSKGSDLGEGSKTETNAYWSDIFHQYVPRSTSALDTWLARVYRYAYFILPAIAIVVLMGGGVVYMTSGGDPGRLKTAKSLMANALIGVALLILARFFLVNVLGVPINAGIF